MARSTTFTFIGEDKFSKVASQVERNAGGMGAKIGKVGKVAAVGLAAAGTAAVAAGYALASMAKDAAADEKSQARLATVLKNTTGATKGQVAAVEAWISKTGEATGVADDKMRPAMQRLVAATGNVGDAQKLMSVAMDASTATGTDLETVAKALAKAQDGNTGALSRLGVATKDADGKALSFEDTVKNMNKTFGGSTTAAAETVEGKFGRLKLMFDETKEAIGARLLPVLSSIGTWIFEKGIPAVRKFAEDMLPKLRNIWDGIRKTIDENRPGLEKIAGVLKVVGEFVLTKVVPAFLKFQGVVVKLVITAIGKLGEILPPIVASYLRGLAGIVRGFTNLYKGALTALSGILTVAEKTMGWIPGIGDKIKSAKAGFESFRESSVDKLGKVEAALLTAAGKIDEVGAKASAMPEAKLKADITDLEAKIATAKTALGQPGLTQERKAKLKADIDDLKSKVDAAKLKLAEVKDRSVSITATLTINKVAITQGVKNKLAGMLSDPRFLAGGVATGGYIAGPGSGTSDTAGVFALSNGEYVVRAASVAKYGRRFFDALNAGTLAGAPTVAPAGVSGGSGSGVVAVNLYLDGRQIQRSLIDLQNNTGRAVIPAVA